MTDDTPEFHHRYIEAAAGDGRTLLLLHGTGGSEDDLLQLGAMVAPTAARLGVRGQVMEGHQARFFRRLAPGVFDERDLVQRAAELAGFVKNFAQTHGRDLGALSALGYSNGANMAASLLLLWPDTLGSAVLLRPMIPLVPEKAPDLSAKKVLILSGDQDQMIPEGGGERLRDLLAGYGAEVTFHLFHAAHGLTPEDLEAARTFMAAG